MLTEQDTACALEAAQQAGEVIKHHFGKKLQKRRKGIGKNDFSTVADLQSEAIIIKHIQQNFPDDNIIAEESHPLPKHNNGRVWIIDPLDGTYNFTQGIKRCGVMIALSNEKTIQLSLLFNPFEEIFVLAQRGKGVFLNKVQKRINMTEPNLQCVADKGFAPILSISNISAIDLWSSVDNALLILNGVKNAYFNRTAKAWDLAPLSLCFKEYGLSVQTEEMEPYRWDLDPQSLVAVPPALRSQVKTILKGVR